MWCGLFLPARRVPFPGGLLVSAAILAPGVVLGLLSIWEAAMDTAQRDAEGDGGKLDWESMPGARPYTRGVSARVQKLRWPASALVAFTCVGLTAGTLRVQISAPQARSRSGGFLSVAAYAADLSGPKEGAGIPDTQAPCEYEEFIKWFQEQDWDAQNLSMRPALSWFDVDAAVATGPRKAWFAGKDMAAEAGVAKRVNRFLFMQDIMASGVETSQASLPLHLLILWLVRDKLAQPGASVLDAGSGTGWLAQAFALSADDRDARILGFDIDERDVELARKHLDDPRAIAGTCKTPTPHIFQGDLLADGFGLGAPARQEVLERRYDVINVGIALEDAAHSAVFRRLALLLKDGGKMTVPVCTEPRNSKGSCKADFRVFQRTGPAPGNTVQEVHSAYSVVFIVAEHNGTSG